MKKRTSSRQNPKAAVKAKRARQSVTIGMDLGDKTSRYCLLSDEGEILREGQVGTTKAGMTETFGRIGRARIAIEVGTHSPWVSRLLRSFGHELIVANPRQVKLITESSRKDDRLDAQTLARLARIDPQLLRLAYVLRAAGWCCRYCALTPRCDRRSLAGPLGTAGQPPYH